MRGLLSSQWMTKKKISSWILVNTVYKYRLLPVTFKAAAANNEELRASQQTLQLSQQKILSNIGVIPTNIGAIPPMMKQQSGNQYIQSLYDTCCTNGIPYACRCIIKVSLKREIFCKTYFCFDRNFTLNKMLWTNVLCTIHLHIYLSIYPYTWGGAYKIYCSKNICSKKNPPKHFKHTHMHRKDISMWLIQPSLKRFKISFSFLPCCLFYEFAILMSQGT